jgi:hypothetical protein
MTSYIWLSGNPGDGYTAYGPYEDSEDAITAHERDEGYLLTLYPPQIELGEIG